MQWECNHDLSAPKKTMLGLAVRQAGAGRHRCAVCAYDLGLRLSLNKHFKSYNEFISSYDEGEVFECDEGKLSPNPIVLQIPVSQSGSENGKEVSRHKCVTCALAEGFTDGIKQRSLGNLSFQLVERPAPSTGDFIDRGYNAQKLSYKWTEDKEKMQRFLGALGEKAVLKHEENRLKIAGLWRKDDCQPRWVSNLDGDQMGYDVLSYFKPKQEKWIEVKTTSGDINTPFHISSNQLSCSQNNLDKFELYRLFNFDAERNQIEFYVLKGDVAPLLHLAPTTFRAKPK